MVCIAVLGHEALKDDPGYHHIFELRERSTHRILHPDLDRQGRRDPLARWLLYLGGIEPENLTEVTMSEPLIAKALNCEEIFLRDQASRRLYELRDKAIRDEISWRLGERDLGRAEGIQRGIQQGEQNALRKVILAMRSKGMDDGAIAQILGHTVEEVQRWGADTARE